MPSQKKNKHISQPNVQRMDAPHPSIHPLMLPLLSLSLPFHFSLLTLFPVRWQPAPNQTAPHTLPYPRLLCPLKRRVRSTRHGGGSSLTNAKQNTERTIIAHKRKISAQKVIAQNYLLVQISRANIFLDDTERSLKRHDYDPRGVTSSGGKK